MAQISTQTSKNIFACLYHTGNVTQSTSYVRAIANLALLKNNMFKSSEGLPPCLNPTINLLGTQCLLRFTQICKRQSHSVHACIVWELGIVGWKAYLWVPWERSLPSMHTLLTLISYRDIHFTLNTYTCMDNWLHFCIHTACLYTSM